MEPWKKVANIDSSFDSKSSKAKELKTDMDTFNMLAILDKLNQNNISKLDKEVIDSTENDVKSKSEYQQSEVKSSNELQLENQDKSLEDINNNSDINALGDDNSSDEAKTDTASDAAQKQSDAEKKTNKDNKFLDKIYSLIKLKRETQPKIYLN